MDNILERIISQKQKEIEILRNNILTNIQIADNNQNRKKSFKASIQKEGLSIIGEIKRKSPSKGNLATILDPSNIVQQYVSGGVSAISVVTDTNFFAGSTYDLQNISRYLEKTDIPILRKEFILDSIQIQESYLMGANAILLIISILKDKTKELFSYAKRLGLDVIVEVHNKEELDLAIKIGANIIGINNRNLFTFEESINICLELSREIPKGIIKIAESAIKTEDNIKRIKKAGFDAVLIGETLVKSKKPADTIKQLIRA